MEVVYFIILCWSIAIWTVVGFLCWIPILLRMTAVFSTMIIISAINQSDDDLDDLKYKLEKAIMVTT